MCYNTTNPQSGVFTKQGRYFMRTAKNLLIVFMALMVATPSILARPKPKRAGEIDNGVYKDKEFDFSFKILDNWKAELQKPGSDMRLDLQQENYKIPPELMPYPGMAQVPNLELYIYKIDMTPGQFIDSLESSTYSSDEKKHILNAVYALEEKVFFTGLERDGKTTFNAGNLEVVKWQGRMNFRKKLGMDDTIPRVYGLAIYAVKHKDEMLTFTLVCEVSFLNDLAKEVEDMVKTLQWK
jgi:hypothetical protein